MAVSNPLYQRFAGLHPTHPKIPVHYGTSLLSQWAKGVITGADAQTALTTISGVPLDTTETQQASDLVAAVPTGTTAAQVAARAMKILDIIECLVLLEAGIAGYVADDMAGTTTVAGGKLGVLRRDAP